MIRRILGGNRQAVNTNPNTFIGGVSSTIPDKQSLATKLSISVNDIGYFAAIGNNIEAAINVDYVFPILAFKSDTNITYYRDTENRIKNLNTGVFELTTKIISLEYKGVTNWTLGNSVVRNSNVKRFLMENAVHVPDLAIYEMLQAKTVYIPRATTLGPTVGQDFVFSSIPSTAKIYLHPSLATSNNGGVEGDVALAISRGATIRYVQNFTKPSVITNLSHSAGVLNFTPPASSNALDFYEVWVNELYKQDISGSGATVTGLNTGDKVTVYACDIYYNRSKSNEITI